MSDRRFKFSVVMPVYDVEGYVAEAIESVIDQTLGFEDNIELIVVNDGSPDESESICLEFQSRYPDNITYLRQENAGVSEARNNGMRRARGDYVNFLDSDDRWAPDAFEEAWRFIAEHPGIEVIAARMHFFDAAQGAHALDHKFHENRVVDIVQDPAHPQLSGVSVFVRREALDGHAFDARLTLSQDFRFITPIILAAGRYGLLGSATYWYRRRQDASSSIGRSAHLRTWYLDSPRFCYRDLFELSKRDFGEVLPYVQHCVMYDLQWRLTKPDTNVLTNAEYEQYKQLLTGLLVEIDDSIILQQRHMFTEYKLYALTLKHGKTLPELRRDSVIERTRVVWESLTVARLKTPRLIVELVERRGDSLVIEGYVTSVLAPEDVTVSFDGRGQHVTAVPVDRPELRQHSLRDVVLEPAGFSATIPLGDRIDVRATVRLKQTDFAALPVYANRARLAQTMETSYFRDGEYTVYRTGERIAARRHAGAVWHLKREVRYLAEMISQKKPAREVADRIAQSLAGAVRRREL